MPERAGARRRWLVDDRFATCSAQGLVLLPLVARAAATVGRIHCDARGMALVAALSTIKGGSRGETVKSHKSQSRVTLSEIRCVCQMPLADCST